jgi:hypothetical protein
MNQNISGLGQKSNLQLRRAFKGMSSNRGIPDNNLMKEAMGDYFGKTKVG